MKNEHPAQSGTQPRILFNYYADGNVEGEAFVCDHIFSYIVSGTHDIWVGDQLFSFKAGDYRFFRRNQLTRYVKKPSGEGFKSIAVHIDQATLKELANEYSSPSPTSYNGPDVLLLKPNQYLNYYIGTATWRYRYPGKQCRGYKS